MKKGLCLLLVVSLLLGVCASALAEPAYVAVKNALNNSIGDGISISVDSPLDDNAVVLLIDPFDYTVILSGLNESNALEATVWEAEDTIQCIALFTVYCDQYDLVQSVAVRNRGFQVILQTGKDENLDFIIVSDSEMAAAMAQYVREYFGIDEE